MHFHNNMRKKKPKHHSFGKYNRFQKSRNYHHPDVHDQAPSSEEKRREPVSTSQEPDNSSITEENITVHFNGSIDLIREREIRENQMPTTNEPDIPIPYFNTIIILCTCLAFVGLGFLIFFNRSKKTVHRKVYLQQANNYRPPCESRVMGSKEKKKMEPSSSIPENLSVSLLFESLKDSNAIWPECQSSTGLSKPFYEFNVDYSCSICNMNSIQVTRQSSSDSNKDENLLKVLQHESRVIKEPDENARIGLREENNSKSNINCPVINILTYNGFAKQLK